MACGVGICFSCVVKVKTVDGGDYRRLLRRRPGLRRGARRVGLTPARGGLAMNFEQSVVISAPADVLFSLTQDYSRRLEWDPFLKSAALVGGATGAAVGVRALCVAHNGMGMETEYVSFNPPRVTAVKMTRGPWVIAQFAGSWRFEEIGAGETRVTFEYHLGPARPGCADAARRVGVRARHAEAAGGAEEGGGSPVVPNSGSAQNPMSLAHPKWSPLSSCRCGLECRFRTRPD